MEIFHFTNALFFTYIEDNSQIHLESWSSCKQQTAQGHLGKLEHLKIYEGLRMPDLQLLGLCPECCMSTMQVSYWYSALGQTAMAGEVTGPGVESDQANAVTQQGLQGGSAD